MTTTTTSSTADLIALGSTARMASFEGDTLQINPNAEIEDWGDVVANVDGLDAADVTPLIGWGEFTHVVAITDANGDKVTYAVAP
ncbi:hypothetical protein [Azospirillum sp. A29]|uniref:hypothetical protein n=1 Tax=unclassified Azospirillum TaxID=2630922 RepID=UPI003673587B